MPTRPNQPYRKTLDQRRRSRKQVDSRTFHKRSEANGLFSDEWTRDKRELREHESKKRLRKNARYGFILGSCVGALIGLAYIKQSPWLIPGGALVGGVIGARVGLGSSEAGYMVDDSLGPIFLEVLGWVLSSGIGCCVTLLATIASLLATILCLIR